ncbi:MAG: glycosyltransferase family 39 protein [Burkholderiales bacterium]
MPSNLTVMAFVNTMAIGKKLFVPLYFAALIVLGLSLFADYGISYDESTSRTNGMVSLNHILKTAGVEVFKGDQELEKFNVPLETYADRDYGVAFEIPLAAAERLLALADVRQQYLFRHLATFLAFMVGVFAVYRLAARRFSSWAWGLIAATMLIASPRFFAEAFYNDKDIVFMACIAIAMNTMVLFLERPSARTLLLHAMATGFAIDVRVMGIFLPVITLCVMGARVAQRQMSPKHAFAAVLGYLAVTAAVVYVFWPWLWSDPWANFAQAVNNMSHYRWHGMNRYLGAFVPASRIPWHYVPVWLGVTTPPLYLGLFLVGSISIAFPIIARRRLWSESGGMQDFLFLGIFAGAVLSIIALKSVLYDGWRQLYFIYPAFLMIAVRGMHVLWTRTLHAPLQRLLLGAVIVAALANTIYWMIGAHPFQNVYFNRLAGVNWASRFDMDYWGLSNRAVYEYILTHDERPIIKVWPVSNTPVLNGAMMVDPASRNRIVLAEGPEDADYLVNNYRFLKGEAYKADDPSKPLWHQILVDGQAILSIYKGQK